MAIIFTPDDVLDHKKKHIPEEVFDAFNYLLVENAGGNVKDRITITQDSVVELICSKLELERNKFNFSWLNIESVYEAAGWKVEYVKAHYSDSQGSYFVFTAK